MLFSPKRTHFSISEKSDGEVLPFFHEHVMGFFALLRRPLAEIKHMSDKGLDEFSSMKQTHLFENIEAQNDFFFHATFLRASPR